MEYKQSPESGKSSGHRVSWSWFQMTTMVVGNVVSMVREKFKVFDPIVISGSVPMVDYLMPFQNPTKVVLHNKPMLKDITPGICERVIRFLDVNVATFITSLSTPPARGIAASPSSFWIRRKEPHVLGIAQPASFSSPKPDPFSTIRTNRVRLPSALCSKPVRASETHSSSTTIVGSSECSFTPYTLCHSL